MLGWTYLLISSLEGGVNVVCTYRGRRGDVEGERSWYSSAGQEMLADVGIFALRLRSNALTRGRCRELHGDGARAS